ncbi:hypothetical protein N9E32_00375 [Alphaproteobacteria bacterium]|nr:hypothetical protein [Alphaproteobacteria bacterium]
MKTLLAILLLIPSLSWGLGENIKNNKDAIKEKIQDKVEVARSNDNKPIVSSANKELIHQIKNNFTSIEDLEEALTSAVKEQGKEKLIEDILTNIEKKVIVAENLYKKLNDNDLNEIANLLIAIRVLDEMTYLSLVNVKSQFHNAAYQAVYLAVHQACIIISAGLYASPDDPRIIFYQTFCE